LQNGVGNNSKRQKRIGMHYLTYWAGKHKNASDGLVVRDVYQVTEAVKAGVYIRFLNPEKHNYIVKNNIERLIDFAVGYTAANFTWWLEIEMKCFLDEHFMLFIKRFYDVLRCRGNVQVVISGKSICGMYNCDLYNVDNDIIESMDTLINYGLQLGMSRVIFSPAAIKYLSLVPFNNVFVSDKIADVYNGNLLYPSAIAGLIAMSEKMGFKIVVDNVCNSMQATCLSEAGLSLQLGGFFAG
jgi:hypothetical protein